MHQRRMRDNVTEARVAALATIDPSGRPHIVPFTFVLDGDRLYSAVDRKPKTTQRLQRLRNIEENPEVCVLVDHYSDNWDELWWVRLRGEAEVVTDATTAERAVDLLAEKYERYRTERPQGPVIAIRITEWKGWTASP